MSTAVPSPVFRRIRSVVAAGLVAGLALGASACGTRQRMIRGTTIHDTATNRALLEQVDEYRRAVERGDVEALMLMASPDYTEDSGTATASDDYGYDGLREVLASRFRMAKDIRYAIRTVGMRQQCPSGDSDDGCVARVEIIVDASFTVVDARGIERRADKRDQNELVFVRGGDRWLVLSGM